jgi:quercetin dioxygenase-like cupin family protein
MQTAAVRRFPHIPAGAGAAYAIIGELLTFKVTNADTNAAFTVVELVAQPGGGPPLHTHPSSESFTILEGAFEFTGLENDQPFTIRAVPGDTVFIPGNAPHAYRAVGARPGKTMLVFTPGTEMERFFIDAGEPVAPGTAVPSSPPDIPAMIAIAQKHGMIFLPPPGP